MASHLEQALLTQIKMLKLPMPETELKVIEGRRFRYDLGWPDHSLLCEIQGATWVKGGHSTGVGIRRDCEKNNLAVLDGWRVLVFTGDHIKSGQAALWIKQALAQREE